MKSFSEESLEFVNTVDILNTNFDKTKVDLRLKIKRHDLFFKALYETKTKRLNILANFEFFNFFDKIDIISKKLILKTINPKYLIFLGKSNIAEHLNEMNSSIRYINAGESTNLLDHCEILNIKYNTGILLNKERAYIPGYGNIYKLNSNLLKVKTKRKPEIDSEANIEDMEDGNSKQTSPEIVDIQILDDAEIEEAIKSGKIFKKLPLEFTSNENMFYSKNSLKITELKNELSQTLKEDLLIKNNSITNYKQNARIYLESDSTLVLEGEFGPEYLKFRKGLYDRLNNKLMNN